MNNDNFKLTLSFVTPDGISDEHLSQYPSFEDSLEDADDLAFSTVGFPLDHWTSVDFGEGNRLYFFYPNEDDKSSRYKLTIVEDSE